MRRKGELSAVWRITLVAIALHGLHTSTAGEGALGMLETSGLYTTEELTEQAELLDITVTGLEYVTWEAAGSVVQGSANSGLRGGVIHSIEME